MIAERPRSAELPVQRQSSEVDRPKYIGNFICRKQGVCGGIRHLRIQCDVKVVIQRKRVPQRVAVDEHRRREEQSYAQRVLHQMLARTISYARMLAPTPQ